MTKEERAEKWSRGIPEMECLTQQEKEEICRRVTFQLLVLTGILAGAALCCLSFLSLEDPAFFDVLNHSADKVNEIHKNVHSMAKRQGAAVMSLPYVLPLVLPIVIPVLAVVYFLKKPLLRREAGKLSQRWRLETDVNTTVQFASEDIKKTMELLQKDDVAGHFRTGIFKRIVRQADSAQKVGSLCQVFPDGGVRLIQCAF